MASVEFPHAAAADPAFGWSEFACLIGQKRGFIVKCALLCVALTAGVMVITPSRYSASAVVMLDQQKNTVADSSSVLTAPPPDPAGVQNQIQILTSRDLADTVVDEQNLMADATFNPALVGPGLKARLLAFIGLAKAPEQATRAAVVDAFLKAVDASQLGLSTSIEVSVTARDPDQAARLANALVTTYVERQIVAKREAARQAAAWLNARIGQLAAQLEEETIAAERYKSDHDLVDSGQAASLIEQQLTTISTQIVAAQSDLAEKRAAYQRAQSLMKDGRAADLSQIVASPLMVQLHTQEAELVRQEADMTSRYGPNHPKLVAVRTQKRDLEAKIRQEGGRIVGSIANDVEVARAHLGALQSGLKRTGRESRGDNLARVTLNALTAKAATTRQTYEAFVARLRGVQDQDAIQTPESRIISHAAPPLAPSSPRRLLFIAASLPLGAMLGVLLALIQAGTGKGAPSTRRHAPEMPAMRHALPRTLAELPATRFVPATDAVLDAPASSYSAAIAALCGQLLPRRGHVLALTGLGRDAAQSVLALALARSAAARGVATVVIETGPAFLLPGLGRPALGGGLAELLNGRTRLERAVVRDPRGLTYVLPAGRTDGGTERWLHLSKMAELLAYFRKSGYAVVIDAPPSFEPATHGLACLCDSVALLVPAAMAPAQRVEALSPLMSVARKVAGLVAMR